MYLQFSLGFHFGIKPYLFFLLSKYIKRNVKKLLSHLFPAGSISGDIIDELMSSDVFPLLRLSPTPADDYNFNLDDNEGVCDLFDVQILNY